MKWDWEGYKKYSKGERILTDILSYTSYFYCKESTILGQLYFFHLNFLIVLGWGRGCFYDGL